MNTPEVALLIAVIDRGLRDAVGDIEAEVLNKRGVAGGARAWFLSDDREPFSFLWICEAIDWDPESIRKVIKKEETKARIEKEVRFAIWWRLRIEERSRLNA